MTTEQLIFGTFASLFQDRVYPGNFPQTNGVIPVPAARYTVIGGTIDADIVGVGFEATDDVSFQLDVIAATATARATLRAQIRAAASAVTPPMVLRAPPTQDFDAETKTFRESFEFTIYGSD